MPTPATVTRSYTAVTPKIVCNIRIMGAYSLDAAMTQADTEQNTTTRISDYNAIEQQVVWQGAWIPYDQPEALWLQRTWVHGFGLSSLDIMPDINWPSVYIAAHSSS